MDLQGLLGARGVEARPAYHPSRNSKHLMQLSRILLSAAALHTEPGAYRHQLYCSETFSMALYKLYIHAC